MDTLVDKWATRQVTPHDGDDAIFMALNQHGPLPPPIIYEFAKEHFASLTSLKNRLTALTSCKVGNTGEGYLYVPGKALLERPIRKHYVYANTEVTDDYLLGKPLTEKRSPALSYTSYHHALFLACATASIEIACQDIEGLEFQSEASLSRRIPSGSREMPCHIEYDHSVWDKSANGWRAQPDASDEPLIPDAYFTFKRFANGRQQERAFFLEVDRGTEPLTRYTLKDKSILATVLKYRHIREKGYYKEHFGLTGPAYVLFLCPTQKRADGIKRIIDHVTGGKGSNYMCTAVWPEFANRFFVPNMINRGLVLKPWPRVGKDPKTNLPYIPFKIAE